MKKFLRKIGLINDITVELPITKTEFIKKFKENVDFSELGFASSMFEVFDSSKNNYKGFIDNQKFKIRKRQRFFDKSKSIAITEGTITENSNSILIKMEIIGFHNRMFFFMFVFLIFYFFFLFGFFLVDNPPVFIFPFIIFHALLMFGIPYFMIKSNVKSTMYSLPRDFHYWATKN